MRGLGWVRLSFVRLWPLLALAVFLVAVVAPVALGSARLQLTVTGMLINVILVVGIYIFVGNSGVLSFGHISFMAIGAYAAAIITIPLPLRDTLLPDLPGLVATLDIPTVPAVLIAGAVAGAFALVIGIPLMRLSGFTASVATFAVLVGVTVVISNWEALTRARKGMLGVPIDTTMFGALGWALVVIAVAFAFQQSRLGLRLRGSRDDPYAAQSVGIAIVPERVLAFALSAAVVGVGGALYGHLQGTFVPDTFFFELTAITYVMLVVGGMKSLAGAVVGAVLISWLSEGLRRFEEGFDIGALHVGVSPGLQELGLALLMLVVLIVRPEGVTGGKEITWPFGRPPRADLASNEGSTHV